MESRLKEILEEEGRTQKWLCNRAKVTATTMTSLVTKKRLPTLPVAYRIAKALKRPIEEIWYEENDKD